MTETDSGTTYPAIEYFLRGVALDVVHASAGGAKPVTREAIVLIETVTFLSRFGLGKGTRHVSTASVTFLESVSVSLEDTIRLPAEEISRKVLKVTQEYAPHRPRGYTVTVRLA